MAAHQPKATQIKARKRVAASNAKSGKLKARHKSASPPKKKPSLASKSLAKKKPAAKKTNAAVKTKPLAKTQAKPAPKPELKSRAGKVQAPDKGGMPSKLTPKGNAANQGAPATKPARSAKQIAKQQAVKLSAKQKQDLRKGEQKPENVEARRMAASHFFQRQLRVDCGNSAKSEADLQVGRSGIESPQLATLSDLR